MEITKNQIKIINLFRKNVFLETNIRSLMFMLKSNSYQRIYEATQDLIQKNILTTKKIGKTNIVKLKFSRESIINLSYLDEITSTHLPNYDEIIKIKEITNYIILVTGSYANNTQTKKSDMDLVIIVPDDKEIVSIQRFVETKTMLLIPKIHLFVLRKKDFLDMLTEKNVNYAKEIVNNKSLLKNAQAFYELLEEGIENGYKG
ncbi:MAG: nucleotidyltransferase domain-containing protein [Candidatus Nanoarchaeia archaeon]|nr:nucleotidyltransferase domain-containing protein [Candidatus Nanoarchaeia archaeon]